MSVPTYDQFIEPVLRFLATKPEGALSRDVQDAAADLLNLDDEQRAETIASGQLVYKNRTGWAHDRLKRAGLSQSLSRGKWCLTAKGTEWLQQHPQPLTDSEVEHIALAFTNIKLQQNNDAVDLDPIAETPHTEAMLTSSPDDRLEQSIKEIRDAVATELLENLLQVSPGHFEIIVLDVLHRLGYGGHRDDLKRVGGSGDAGIDGVISLDKLGLEKVYVQAKRWQNTVGRPELHAFSGALIGQKAKRGIFITTSGFTKHAIAYAQSVEGRVLIDGNRLVHLMMDNEVGVSSMLLKVPKLDSDYFDQ
ncbi:restriction endonuclease [Serratia proteamaculans]